LKKQGKSVRSLPEPDLKFVKQALLSIGSVAPEGALIILESTSPVGTTELMALWFMEIGLDPSRYHFAYCPERVIPGDVRRELINNDRLVGGLDLASTLAAKKFYNIFVKGTVWTCSARVAELSKLAENTFRDINIGFANELSLICDELDLNCNEVIRLTNKHPRVNILQPGIGVGGHCIAVDPWFIASMFPNKTPLIQSARQVNDAKTDHVIDQVIGEIKKLEECLQRPVVVSLFGLAYKANVSDVRGSPAVKIAKKLQQLGVRVLCVDPLVENIFGLELFDFETAACSSDLGIFLVKHEIFEEYKTQLEGFVKTLDFCNFGQCL
jgi:UDP-N-acetyl-D-mannosaminuronic acid dehydrogenase